MKNNMIIPVLVALLPLQGASAETITYSYDALGRLVSSNVSGGPASGAVTGIAYDAAGNRTSYNVSGRTAANSTAVGTPNERKALAERLAAPVNAVASPA